VTAHIRDATIDDLAAVVALLADDELGATREQASDPLPRSYHDAFAAIDADPHSTVLVAELDGRIVGTLQVHHLPHLTFRGGWRTQVEGVRVAREVRGHGVGEQLLRRAIAEARARDCHVVQLTTNLERSDAHRFYRALGFEATHTGMKLYLDGDVTGRSGGRGPDQSSTS
jgi:GNAT superfamily N-acetyltransferase